VRLPGLERMLEEALHQKGDDAGRASLLRRIREEALAAVKPIDDQRSTAEYRREVAANFVVEFARRTLAGNGNGSGR